MNTKIVALAWICISLSVVDGMKEPRRRVQSLWHTIEIKSDSGTAFCYHLDKLGNLSDRIPRKKRRNFSEKKEEATEAPTESLLIENEDRPLFRNNNEDSAFLFQATQPPIPSSVLDKDQIVLNDDIKILLETDITFPEDPSYFDQF